MRIETLFDYSDNCWSLLAETLRKYPDELHRTFETTSPYKSIAQLFAHSVGAEERWITHRIQGIPITIMYEQRQSLTLDGLFADAELVRTETRRFLTTLDEAGLARVVSFSLVNPTGFQGEVSLTIEQILFHIINHETYHRGQIIAALQRLGIDPPNFDYALLHE